MKKVTLLTFILSFVVFSCGEQEVMKTQPQPDYQEFAKELTNTLDQVANDLRNNHADFSNVEQVKKSFEYALSSGSLKNDISAFSTNFEKVQSWSRSEVNGRNAPTIINVSQFEYDVLRKVDALWKSDVSEVSYGKELENLMNEVSVNNISSIKKEPIMLFLVAYRVAFDFAQNNSELLGRGSANGKIEGWSWRCAAAIVGSAGTVGLGGFYAGAAGGAVVIPIVGSVPGGVVGAVIGAIAGGLTAFGTADACGSGSEGKLTIYINICVDEGTRDACVVEEDRISIEDAYPLFNLDSDG